MGICLRQSVQLCHDSLPWRGFGGLPDGGWPIPLGRPISTSEDEKRFELDDWDAQHRWTLARGGDSWIPIQYVSALRLSHC